MECANPSDTYLFESKKISLFLVTVKKKKRLFLVYFYKALLDIHLLNMTKHSLGRYSGAVCPPP